ncbi:hypothetical protein E8E14_014233 [Neopestalotiopsis sp. 37M]|nr:hypothetical protein E8E14_014233 [Neopestalotiopsis sp. 37M]
MANFTGTSGSEEFAGDEFSNNLFSDLAPLLTLFGEQVTKQFLSMRARESQSDAEQELLSSTSNDVCELWSGHEVVRVMGQPAGMKTLIISDKKVYDIKSALGRGVLERINIDNEDLDSLADAAPNLTLNIRNATAPAWELWTWAAVGTILQLIAVVIPGIATYVWQWPKAGVKVQDYGYPCFVIGTTFVVLGTMICGHVIEGITTEHKFTKGSLQDYRYFGLHESSLRNDMQIVRLQRACTVSDQHFSSYAIFNEKGNHVIRTSRLNDAAGYRRGLSFDPKAYIILDGHEIAWLTLHILSKPLDGHRDSLDAVHQTAKVTPPRGTAIELIPIPNLRESSTSATPTAQREFELQDRAFWDIQFPEALKSDLEIIWEPIMGFNSYLEQGREMLNFTDKVTASEAARVVGILEEDLYMFQQFFSPLLFDAPIDVKLTDQPTLNEDDTLNLYKQIAAVTPADNAVINAARSLTSVVERVMNILCDNKNIIWKGEGVPIAQVNADKEDSDAAEASAEVSDVSWGFTIATRLPSDKQAQTKKLYFRMAAVYENNVTLGPNAGPIRWQLHDRDSVVGVLSLWLSSIQPGTPDQDMSGRDGGNLFITTRDDSSLEIQFAQELFSLFVLAMAGNISKVRGHTVYDELRHMSAREMSRPAICSENSVFSAIATEVVNGGLAHDTMEAYSLIIPAFYKLNILPEPGESS